MRGRCCSICLSPAREAVDDALMAGGKLVPVAKQFGFSKSAVARHKSACLAPKLAAAARVVTPAVEVRQDAARASEIASGDVPTLAEVTSLKGLLARLVRSLERLETAADSAAAGEAYAALAAISGQLHRGVEVAGRLQGLGGMGQSEVDAPRFSIVINVPEGAATSMVPARPVEVAPVVRPEPVAPSGLDAPGFQLPFDVESIARRQGP